jgi:hypothetical protein
MTSPQPFPSSGFSTPNSAGSELSAYKDMMGSQRPAQPDNAASLRRQQTESAGEQIRSIGQQLDGLAKQFPVIAEEVRLMKEAMTKRVLVRIIGSQPAESQAPTGLLG